MFLKHIHPKKSILFYLYSSAWTVIESLPAKLKKWKAPHLEELLPVDSDSQAVFESADYIMQIGNSYTVQSLREYGVTENKIIHIHFGLPQKGKPSSVKYNPDSYLYLVSRNRIKKGFSLYCFIVQRRKN